MKINYTKLYASLVFGALSLATANIHAMDPSEEAIQKQHKKIQNLKVIDNLHSALQESIHNSLGLSHLGMVELLNPSSLFNDETKTRLNAVLEADKKLIVQTCQTIILCAQSKDNPENIKAIENCEELAQSAQKAHQQFKATAFFRDYEKQAPKHLLNLFEQLLTKLTSEEESDQKS